MAKSDHPLTQKEFTSIYSKVPRLTVEVIVKNKAGEIYLTLRSIEPCKGQWHLPGGTVRFGEPMTDAVKRIAERELGIAVTDSTLQGYIEYPSHYNNGMDSPVGIVFEVRKFMGDLSPNHEAKNGAWFSQIPEDMHADQDEFLLRNHFLRK